MTDILPDSLTGRSRAALQKLEGCSLKSYERRRIDAVSQISPDRSNGCAIANAEADGVYGVIEILQVMLAGSERNVTERAEDVAHVMEKDALDVLPDEGKSHLDIVKEERVSTEWKARGRRGWTARYHWRSNVSRPGLVVRKRAQRIGAASEKSFWQRNRFLIAESRRRGKRADDTELGLPGQGDGSR